MGYLDFLFLGYSGRIGRLTYWLASFALAGIQFAAIWGLMVLSHGTLAQLAALNEGTRAVPPQMIADFFQHVMLPIMIVAAIFLWPQYALITKRWHDRGKSGWWSLIMFVPIIGGLWALIELGFLPGDDGANAYGYR